jgi:hypothetical protein
MTRVSCDFLFGTHPECRDCPSRKACRIGQEAADSFMVDHTARVATNGRPYKNGVAGWRQQKKAQRRMD